MKYEQGLGRKNKVWKGLEHRKVQENIQRSEYFQRVKAREVERKEMENRETECQNAKGVTIAIVYGRDNEANDKNRKGG